MTFNAASRLRSLEDRSAALGSHGCELPGMHSVPKSAVLPYASGVGGLSRRLLNIHLLQLCFTNCQNRTSKQALGRQSQAFIGVCAELMGRMPEPGYDHTNLERLDSNSKNVQPCCESIH